MNQYLIYFTVFVGVVILTTLIGGALVSGASRSRALNRRMQVLDSTKDRMAGLANVRLERGLRSDGTLVGGFAGLQRLYTQSGVTVGPSRLALYAILFSIVTGLVARMLTGQDLIGLFAGAFALVAGPYVYLAFIRNRRLDTFARQLPEAIDIIVRSLQAGHPLTTSLTLVAEEMPDPIGSEFGMMNDELTYGTDMEVALRNLMQRTPVDDLAMFAMAVIIQRQTGGNLAEILDTLSGTIRDRYLLKQKIRALTSEGRFSAMFMTIFPFLMYLLLLAMMPNYFEPLWDSGYGTIVFGGCLLTMTIGNIVMRRMVNFRV